MANDPVLVTGAAERGNELLLIMKSRLQELLQLVLDYIFFHQRNRFSKKTKTQTSVFCQVNCIRVRVRRIGSFPGFEDGVFESAKLLRPATSFYHASEDSIYFVDSENHAIRRADLEMRVVETVFPAMANGKRYKSFWTWILDKVWPEKLKSEAFNSK